MHLTDGDGTVLAALVGPVATILATWALLKLRRNSQVLADMGGRLNEARDTLNEARDASVTAAQQVSTNGGKSFHDKVIAELEKQTRVIERIDRRTVDLSERVTNHDRRISRIERARTAEERRH